MLSRLELGNFKAFKEHQSLPLRPITLVFGANSSGKSSILHALLLLHHGLTTGDWDARRTVLGAGSVDLGGYPSFVHGHESDSPVQLGVRLANTRARVAYVRPWMQDELDYVHGFGDVTVGIDIGGSYNLNVRADTTPIPTAFRVSSEGTTFIEAFAAGRVYAGYRGYDVGTVNLRAHILRELIRLVDFDADISIDGDAVPLEELESHLNSLGGAPPWLDRFEEGLVDEGGVLWLDQRLRSSIEDEHALSQLLGFRAGDEALREFSLDTGSKEVRLAVLYTFAVKQAISMVPNILDASLSRVDYLGPLRAYPDRRVEAGANPEEFVDSGGAHAWEVMLRNSGVRDSVNQWLGSDRLRTGYRFSERRQYSLEAVDEAYAMMAGRPDHDFLDALNRLPPTTQDLVLTDLRSGTVVSHRDIGLGISQVLPVLVSAFGSNNRHILIEQPEIHLHPALQAELGDVFIQSSKGDAGNAFLIETHSEHLILRLLRRIRETAAGNLKNDELALRPDDVAVLYVESAPSSSRVYEIPITEDGEFAERWPEGFFSERAEELF